VSDQLEGGAAGGEDRDEGRIPSMVTARYDGSVVVGGAAQTREAGGLRITKVAVGDYDNNCYLLCDTATGEQLLIDAAAEAGTLLALTGDALQQVVTTHRHGDHWQALAAVVEATGARTLAGVNDLAAIGVDTDVPLDDHDEVTVGHRRLRVREVVGHTPGAVVLLWEPADGPPHLFTGDCLFPGGPGNTFGDSAAFVQLMDHLEERVFGPLPDTTWVYPGHGADTTLGAERPHLAEWRARGW